MTKSSDAFSILLSQEENSNYDNHFRNCNLHNWFQSSGSSLMVVPVKINIGPSNLASTISSMQQPSSFFNQLSPKFGTRPYKFVSNTNKNL